MWFLSFISDLILQWVIHGLVILGLVLTFIGSLVRFIPIIQPYALIGRQLGVVLLIVGVFFEGGYATEMSYRARIAEMQAKIKEAEVKSAQVNQKLIIELDKKRSEIKDKVNKNAKDIQAQRQKIDAECRLSDTAWMLYNRSIDSKVSTSTTSLDGTSTKPKTTSR
jgi:low affinity Fe/Cu permease